MKKKIICPWVFYINISVRKDWFSYWWSTRGSNFKEFQVWMFKISVGRPWSQIVLELLMSEYGNIEYAMKTNTENLRGPFTILINNGYKNDII